MEDLLKFILIVCVLGGLLALAINMPDMLSSLADIQQSKAEIKQAEVSLKALDIAQAQLTLTGLMFVSCGLVILALVCVVCAGSFLIVKAALTGQASQLYLEGRQQQQLTEGQGVWIVKDRYIHPSHITRNNV